MENPLIAAFLAVPDNRKAETLLHFVASVVASNQDPPGFLKTLTTKVRDAITRRAAKS